MINNNFTSKSFFILPVLIIIIISSCKKDDSRDFIPPTNNGTLSIEFPEKLFYDYGWVVLYDISGTTIKEFKKFEVGETVYFSDTSSIVTFSMILVYNEDNYRQIGIASYFEAPAGSWIIRAGSWDEVGQVDITVQYPEDEYDMGIISTTSWNWSAPRSDISPNELNMSGSVFTLQENQKISIYGTVYKDTIGFCNWAMDQDFQLGQMNYFNMELNQPMIKKYIHFNKPLSILRLNGFYDGRQSLLSLYEYESEAYQGNSNIGMLLIPDGMPISEIRVRAFSNTIEYSKDYDGFDDIPDNISFPESSISANYDEINDAITDIQISGSGDIILANWGYVDNQNNSFSSISWIVYADNSYSILYKPDLPQQISSELGDIMDKLNVKSVSLFDYNTTNNFSDYIYRTHIDNIPQNDMYSQYFRYSYPLY